VLATTLLNHLDRPLAHGVACRYDTDNDIVEFGNEQQTYPA